jgi:acetyl esterase/lipase
LEGERLSIQGRLISALIRPNKLIYRIFRPSAKLVRFYVHPQAWLGSKIFGPFGIGIEKKVLDGVPVVTFTPKKNPRKDKLIVFLHGGGYCFGSSLTTHRMGLATMSKITNTICHSIDYRLAPESPYPAALDDALASWRHITRNNPDTEIILAGDSAGGGLSLALMMYLRDNGEKLPDSAVLFSPWTNLNCDSETYQTKAKADPMFVHHMTKDCARYYVPESIDKNEPYISPAHGDFGGLPRTLIMTGGNEILLDDTRIIGQKATDEDLDIEVDIWPTMFHDWWLFGSFIPETKQCLKKMSEWI